MAVVDVASNGRFHIWSIKDRVDGSVCSILSGMVEICVIPCEDIGEKIGIDNNFAIATNDLDAVSNNYGVNVGFVDDFFWKVNDIVLGLFEFYSGCWEGIVIKCREFFIIRS